MIGWLLAPVLPGAAWVALFVHAYRTQRRSRAASTDVAVWRPQAPQGEPTDGEWHLGFAHLLADVADRYEEECERRVYDSPHGRMRA